MRTTRYLVICLILGVVGLGSLAEGANGNAGADFGTSWAANSVRFCVTTTGVWAVLGVLGTLGAIAFLMLALIASMRKIAA
jgi:hypothetical protein